MVLSLSDYPRFAERLLSALSASPNLFSHFVGVSGEVRRLWEWPKTRGSKTPTNGSIPHASLHPGASGTAAKRV